MNVIATSIPGVLLVEPRVNGDARGFFTELYQEARYAGAGIPARFMQDNLSRSQRGVLRGAVLDVAVDVRRGSPTFGRHVSVELSEENRRQVWIPRGFAHGFLVRSDSADFLYKCDAPYSAADELVLRWNALGIDWGCDDPQLSARDRNGSTLAELAERLPRYEPA